MALGAAGRRVTDPGELPAALAWARDHAPAVLDVMVTQDAPSPDSAAGIAIVPPDQALTKWQLAEEQRRSVAMDMYLTVDRNAEYQPPPDGGNA